MHRTHILNRVRQVVGLPLIVTATGCSPAGTPAPSTSQASPTSPLAQVDVDTLMGEPGSPVTEYLTEDERSHTVEVCLEHFPTCPVVCDLGPFARIDDASLTLEHSLVVSETRFITPESMTCSEPTWQFQRTYYQVPAPGAHGTFAPHGSTLFGATGPAISGHVDTFKRIGTVTYTDGRPFDGHTAPASTVSTNRWLLAAQHEHASIASFARHLLEMMSLGAPVALLQAITRAQQDEVRHTQLCLQRAAQDGVEATLGPLNVDVVTRTSPYAIARGVALEGCINETLAVLAMTDRIATASPADAALLTTISEDEARHAELAWTTLVWLWPQMTSDEQSCLQRQMRQAIPSQHRHALRPMVRALAA